MNVGSKIWKKIKEQGLGTEIKVFLDNWWSRGVMFVKRSFDGFQTVSYRTFESCFAFIENRVLLNIIDRMLANEYN